MDRLDDDLLKRCASYLAPGEMVSLGRVARRFGLPGGDPGGSPPDDSSLVEAAARDAFSQAATDDDRLALPRYDNESSVCLYNELVKLRTPLEFNQLIGEDVYLLSKSHVRVSSDNSRYWNSAISSSVMRSGRHYANFDIIVVNRYLDAHVNVGVIRPIKGWDDRGIENFLPSIIESYDSVSQDLLAERTDKWHGDVHCCSYYCLDGSCRRTDWYTRSNNDWVGRDSLRQPGTIGLLLDLVEGSLSVYKDGGRLGIMATGLMGEYCWFASMAVGNSSVRLERGTLSETG